jgi:3-hydroxybutyryl-CoA dehydrogenase
MSGAYEPATAAEHILQRVGRPYAIEAVRMLESGEAGVLEIDAALEAAGYPLGPLRRLDEVGLDVDLALDRTLSRMYPSGGRFAPPGLQVRLVEEGRCGRAAGRGFYRYLDTEAVPDVAVTAPAGVGPDAPLPTPSALSPGAIVERLELAMVNEAYRVVEDGAGTPPLIDSVMRAAGHPLGPFEMVDRAGLRHIVDRLRALETLTEGRSGDQYRVATLLWQMATV